MKLPRSFAIALATAMLAVTTFASAATVPEGTEVKLRMLDSLSSGTAVEGQRFNLELDDDIRIDGNVVVPRGAKAVGTVTHAKKKGFMGKGGELNVTLDYVTVGEDRIRLRAAEGKEGEDKVGTTVVLTVLFGPLGLLKRGHNVDVNAGTVLTAYVDQTIKL
jgi:hypothetical protein